MGYKLKRILIYPDGVTEKQVYPAGWKPGSNTIAYFPMQGDNLDKVGTFTLDVSGTQQTIGRKFTTQTSLNTTPNGVKTISGWAKIASASGSSGGQCGILATYGNYVCYFSAGDGKYFYAYINNSNYKSNSVNLIDNSWHHVAITSNNGVGIVGYVDGVPYSLGNSSAPRLSKLLVFKSTNNTIDVTLSEVIYENIQWTQAEIQNYYNSTKSNYGL